MTILGIFRWLWEHRTWSMPVVALALGAGLHAHFHTCPSCAPAIAKVEQEHAVKDTATQRDTTKQEGPRHVVKLNFDRMPVHPPDEKDAPADLCRPVVVPGLGSVMVPAGERLESVTIEDEGPSKSETKVATDAHAIEDKKLSLTVTPPPPQAMPRFSLLYEPKILPSVGLGIVGVGIRITRDVWVEAWTQPTAPAFGGGIRITF